MAKGDEARYGMVDGEGEGVYRVVEQGLVGGGGGRKEGANDRASHKLFFRGTRSPLDCFFFLFVIMSLFERLADGGYLHFDYLAIRVAIGKLGGRFPVIRSVFSWYLNPMSRPTTGSADCRQHFSDISRVDLRL